MSSQRRAFTLVELLIVVAIIAIILSLLLPALRSARLSAQGAVCMSHLHQVGLGGNQYALEHKGFLPPYAPRVSVPGGARPTLPLAPGLPPTWQPPEFRRQYLMSEWFQSGAFPAVPRAGDGFFGRYLNTGVGIDTTKPPPNADGTYEGMKFILGCPSEPVGPNARISDGWSMYTYRPFSFAVNYGDHTPWWPQYPGVFDLDLEYWDPLNPQILLGYNVSVLPSKLVLMADGFGALPYMKAPYPSWNFPGEVMSPALRHVNAFNAVAIGGHAKSGSYEERWTTEYWIHQFPGNP